MSVNLYAALFISQLHMPGGPSPALHCAPMLLHQQCEVPEAQVAQMPVLGWLCCACWAWLYNLRDTLCSTLMP